MIQTEMLKSYNMEYYKRLIQKGGRLRSIPDQLVLVVFSIIKVAIILAVWLWVWNCILYSCEKFESNQTIFIFHFFMASPLCKSLEFLHWHFMSGPLKIQRFSDLTQIWHSSLWVVLLQKCNFMHIAKITKRFNIGNFATITNNRSGGS